MKARIGNTVLSSDLIRPSSKPYQIHDERLPGFILRVQPSRDAVAAGPMTYYYEYRLKDGRRKRVKVGRHGVIKPSQARAIAEKYAADVTNKIDPAQVLKESRQVAKAHTLGSYVEEEYKPWAEAHLRTGRLSVARIRTCFKEFFKQPLMDDRFAWQIGKWRIAKKKTGIKKATIDRDVGTLKSVFAHAIRNKKLVANPLVDIKPLKRDGEDDESDERVRFLNQQDEKEEARFLVAIEKREKRIRLERRSANQWRQVRGYDLYPDLEALPFADYLKPMIVVARNTGIRRKELFSITWLNVNLRSEQPLLTIPGRIAKNKKTRYIPLNKIAANTLEEWRSQQVDTSGLIFPSRNNSVRDNLYKAWKKLMEKAQIVNFRWHDLRHDFASRLVMAGNDLNTVRELLGHRDIKMTLRYAHLAPRFLADAVNTLDDLHKPQSLEERTVRGSI